MKRENMPFGPGPREQVELVRAARFAMSGLKQSVIEDVVVDVDLAQGVARIGYLQGTARREFKPIVMFEWLDPITSDEWLLALREQARRLNDILEG